MVKRNDDSSAGIESKVAEVKTMSTESGPQQFCVHWNRYQSNLQEAFEKLFTAECFVDVTLAVETETIKCHKVVLSACSKFFEKLLLQNPCHHPIIFMKDMKVWEVKALVNFMYRGEVSVEQDNLDLLLKSAEALQIRGLSSDSNSQQNHSTPPVQNSSKNGNNNDDIKVINNNDSSKPNKNFDVKIKHSTKTESIVIFDKLRNQSTLKDSFKNEIKVLPVIKNGSRKHSISTTVSVNNNNNQKNNNKDSLPVIKNVFSKQISNDSSVKCELMGKKSKSLHLSQLNVIKEEVDIEVDGCDRDDADTDYVEENRLSPPARDPLLNTKAGPSPAGARSRPLAGVRNSLDAWQKYAHFLSAQPPYKQYSPSTLEQAVHDLRSGKFTSIRACARHHGIPMTTLRYRSKMKHPTSQLSWSHRRQLGRRLSSNTVQGETEIVIPLLVNEQSQSVNN